MSWPEWEKPNVRYDIGCGECDGDPECCGAPFWSVDLPHDYMWVGGDGGGMAMHLTHGDAINAATKLHPDHASITPRPEEYCRPERCGCPTHRRWRASQEAP